MKSLKLFSRLGVVCFGAVTLLTAIDATDTPAADSSKPEKSELVLAYPQASGVFMPIFLADEAGLFKKYGINIKLQQLNPQLSVQAVVSGSADVSVAAGDLVNASLQGANIKLVGSSMSQLVFQLWAAKEITEVPQLKGKMLAGTTPRSVLEIATREILKKHGLDFETDYKLIYVQSVPAILTAISSGRVPAGALSAPTTLKARDTKQGSEGQTNSEASYRAAHQSYSRLTPRDSRLLLRRNDLLELGKQRGRRT